jgi:hypothetical protein
VPEEVARARPRHARAPDVPAHVEAERLQGDRLPLGREEEEAVVRLDDEVGLGQDRVSVTNLADNGAES